MKKSLNLWGVITILTLSLGFTACGDDPNTFGEQMVG